MVNTEYSDIVNVDDVLSINNSITFRDYYQVIPPFGYAGIKVSEDSQELEYLSMEPTLTEKEREILKEIKQILIEKVDIPLEVLNDDEKADEYLEGLFRKVFKKFRKRLPKESQEKFIYFLKRDFIGYGKIDLLIKDQNIEDISCNGEKIPLYVWHREHESIPTNIIFNSKDELDAIITRLAYKAGRQISVARPIIEGTLPNGFRIHLTLDEVSKRGNTFTIRKFSKNAYTIIELIKKGTISAAMAAYLWILVENGRSVMVSGATASGKTTLLNAICTFIQPEMKVVTIEEVRELRLHQNWIPMVTRPSFQSGVEEITLFDLLKSALRQRPDFIIVGEVRGEEAYTLFQSIATGHGGLCTIHSESVESAVKRLATRPMNIPEMIIPLMNVILQIRRIKVGEDFSRRVMTLTELVGTNPEGNPQLQDRFRWKANIDEYIFIPPSSAENDIFTKISEAKQIPLNELNLEYGRREIVLKWMVAKNITSYRDVAEIIRGYYIDSDEIFNRARLEL